MQAITTCRRVCRNLLGSIEFLETKKFYRIENRNLMIYLYQTFKAYLKKQWKAGLGICFLFQNKS